MAFPGTFQDIQNAVIAKARLDATADLAKVKDWINQVYAQVCVETEFVRASTTSALSANNTTVALPAGVIRLAGIRVQPAAGSYGFPMRMVKLEKLLALRATGAAAATPTHYTLAQSTVEFFPAAVGGETVQFWFSKLPTALSANGDTPVIDEPFASKLLEYGALVEALDYMKDFISSYTIRQVYNEWMGQFRDHLARREGAGRKADVFRDIPQALAQTALHQEVEQPV